MSPKPTPIIETIGKYTQVAISSTNLIVLLCGGLFTVFVLFKDVAESKSAIQTQNFLIKELTTIVQTTNEEVREIQAELKYSVRPALESIKNK